MLPDMLFHLPRLTPADISLAWAALPAVMAAGIAALAAARIHMFHSPHDVIGDIRVFAGGAPGRSTVFVISRHNLLKSRDSGAWRRVTGGLGPYKLSAIALSPAFDRDQTLFIASLGGGVYRSEDGGLSFTPCNAGMEQRHILRLAIAPDFAISGVVVALGLDGVAYITRDRGHHWHTLLDPHEGDPQAATLAAARLQSATEILLAPMRDAGESWTLCYHPIGVTSTVIAESGVFLGCSNGALHVSADGGHTWAPPVQLPGKPRITCLETASETSSVPTLLVGTDGAGIWRLGSKRKAERLTAMRPLSRVTALASATTAAGRPRILACAWNAALFVSDDLGASWRCRSEGLTTHRQADEPRYGAPHFSTIATSAARHEIYLGGFDGLFRSDAGGGAWAPVETLSPDIVVGLATSDRGGHAPSLAVSTYGAGMEAQSAVGESWSYRNTGLMTTRLGPVARSPAAARESDLFAGCEGHVLIWRENSGSWQASVLEPPARAGRSARLFARIRSVERELSRHLSPSTLKKVKGAFQAVALRAGGRVSRIVFPTAFAFSPEYPQEPTLFVGTRAHGIFRSSDGGSSFQPLWDCGGRFVFSLAVAPRYHCGAPVFACLPDGLYRSLSGGTSWETVCPNAGFRGATLSMSPAFEQDATLFLGGPRGLYRSRDAGTHWSPLPLAQTTDPSIACVALSPSYASDATLLVQTHGRGLFRSTDGGETFERLSGGLDLAFHPMRCFPDSAPLLQLSPRFSKDRTIVAASMDRVSISTDAGETWRELGRRTRYENFRPEIAYAGKWTLDFHPEHGARQAHRTTRTGDTATLAFVGTQIVWLGTRGPDHGRADVYIDSQLRATLDLYAPRAEHRQPLYSIHLAPGAHRIAVRVREQRNPLSSGSAVCIDAFEVELEGACDGAAPAERVAC